VSFDLVSVVGKLLFRLYHILNICTSVCCRTDRFHDVSSKVKRQLSSSPVSQTQESIPNDSSPDSGSSSLPEQSQTTSTTTTKRVYTTSATAAAAAGRRVLPNTPQSQQRNNNNNNNSSSGRGGGGGRGSGSGRGEYSKPNNRSYTSPSNPDRRYSSTGGAGTTTSTTADRTLSSSSQSRSYTTTTVNGVNGRTGNANRSAPSRSYDSSRGGDRVQQQSDNDAPPLKLLNPLRLVRISEQTPGTNQEIYSSERSGGGGGGGRGPRPMAATGISTL
jgi:hypothetical protein